MRNPLNPIYTSDPVEQHHPINVGRVAWWLTLPPLDGGRQWFDLMGLYPGTLTNMSTSSSGWRGTTRRGGFGNLTFDGSDDRVDISGFSGITGNLSVALWVNPAAVGSTHDDYIVFAAGTGSSNYGIYCSIGGGHANLFQLAPGWLDGTTSLPVGGWSRILYVIRGTTREIWVNGVLDASAASSGTINWGTTRLIGRRVDGLGSLPTFSGSLDDVSIWSRALTAGEVWADYQEGRRGYPETVRRRDFRTTILMSASAPPSSFSPAWVSGPNVLGTGVY